MAANAVASGASMACPKANQAWLLKPVWAGKGGHTNPIANPKPIHALRILPMPNDLILIRKKTHRGP
jgi:hypothetical protein